MVAVLVLGLVAVVAWTTLCLGGYMAKTMIGVRSCRTGLGRIGGIALGGWAGQGSKSRVINRAVLLPLPPFLLYALASVLCAGACSLAGLDGNGCCGFQMWLVFVLGPAFRPEPRAHVDNRGCLQGWPGLRGRRCMAASTNVSPIRIG